MAIQQHIAELVITYATRGSQLSLRLMELPLAEGLPLRALAILDTAVLQLNLVRHSSDWEYQDATLESVGCCLASLALLALGS